MNGQVLAQNPMWLISHDERRFIVHGSSDRMVKHSILDSYVLNPEAEIKGGVVLMDFEKSFPMSFDSYINGLCEGIDKITVTIPSDYVDRTVDIRPYKEGLCSLRKTGRYLTIEIHGEYIHEVPRGGLGHELKAFIKAIEQDNLVLGGRKSLDEDRNTKESVMFRIIELTEYESWYDFARSFPEERKITVRNLIHIMDSDIEIYTILALIKPFPEIRLSDVFM